jgi:hypothetical protein
VHSRDVQYVQILFTFLTKHTSYRPRLVQHKARFKKGDVVGQFYQLLPYSHFNLPTESSSNVSIDVSFSISSVVPELVENLTSKFSRPSLSLTLSMSFVFHHPRTVLHHHLRHILSSILSISTVFPILSTTIKISNGFLVHVVTPNRQSLFSATFLVNLSIHQFRSFGNSFRCTG